MDMAATKEKEAAVLDSLTMATFIISFAILLLYFLAYFFVLIKTNMEAVKQHSTNIVLAAFLISFISRTISDGLRVVLIGVSDSKTEEIFEKILEVSVFIITASLSAKSLGIFYFIFDLLALRVKLDAVQISDYNL
jgi:hypothetical protein